MFKIGDFSKLSSVSIRMLRHYDKIQLLAPAKVDTMTGYRFYSAEQLVTVNRIQQLRSLGFSLATAQEILDSHDDTQSFKEHLSIRYSETKEEIENLRKQLLLLKSSIQTIGEDVVKMNYHVNIKEIPARQVASLRQSIPAYHHEGDLWTQLMTEIHSQNVKIANLPLSLAIFHDEEYRESDVDVEIQINVMGSYSDTESVIFKTTEKVVVASITVSGRYDQMTMINEAAAKWIESEKYEIAGPMFNIYHVSPAIEEDPNKWVTEVCYPIKKAEIKIV